jgi:rare lipoprotein A
LFQEATPWSLATYFLFLMLRFAFLSASIALGAMVPFAAEAKLGCGPASHYGLGDGFHGQIAADGSRFSAYGLTAASPSIPLGAKVRVVNRDNGKSVVVTITDRGPWYGDRMLDLAYGAFARIANPSRGVANVCMARA